VAREVHAARVISVADVGSQREDDRQRLLLSGRPVESRSQLDAVAHRDPDDPLHVHVQGFFCGCDGGEGEKQKDEQRGAAG